jgi:hypothetical protein
MRANGPNLQWGELEFKRSEQSFGFQRAMAYLTSIKQLLEADPTGYATMKAAQPSKIQPQDDPEDDQVSDTDSVLDDTASVSSNGTIISTLDANTANAQNTTVYRYKDMTEVLL